MIRRTLQGGLLAVVALFALVPTAAVAAVGDHVTPAPVVGTVPHRPHTMLPVLVRHEPVRHSARHSMRCHHHARHFRHIHHVRHTRFFTGVAYHRHVTQVGRVGTRHVLLNVRSGPGFGYRVVGHRHVQGRLLVVCRTHGSYVHGNRCWYRLVHGNGYVSAHYVRMWRAASWC
ncbi:SH3 domain-containing protein [Streptomyces colonosanans]|nr:SH3 domain-containing protein [Streptomyces colonosanans]